MADNTSTSGGGNPPPSTGTTGSSGSSSAIGDLTSGLKDIQKNGKADLKLSTAARDKYLQIISTYRTALETERKKMNNQESLGDPGGFQSGILTKQNLMLDMTGLTGAQRSMDQYLDYLDEFAKTVKKACDNLINSG